MILLRCWCYPRHSGGPFFCAVFSALFHGFATPTHTQALSHSLALTHSLSLCRLSERTSASASATTTTTPPLPLLSYLRYPFLLPLFSSPPKTPTYLRLGSSLYLFSPDAPSTSYWLLFQKRKERTRKSSLSSSLSLSLSLKVSAVVFSYIYLSLLICLSVPSRTSHHQHTVRSKNKNSRSSTIILRFESLFLPCFILLLLLLLFFYYYHHHHHHHRHHHRTTPSLALDRVGVNLLVCPAVASVE